MKAKTATNQSRVASGTNQKVDSQIYGAGLTAVAVAAGLVGLWAAAALVGGMVASGGPLALAGDWFKAVFGL